MKALVCLLAFALGSVPALAQPPQRDWNEPFPAHRIMDNLYFVGTVPLGTFLVTTPAWTACFMTGHSALRYRLC